MVKIVTNPLELGLQDVQLFRSVASSSSSSHHHPHITITTIIITTTTITPTCISSNRLGHLPSHTCTMY